MDGASIWKEAIATYLVGHGMVELTKVGEQVPRPAGFSGKLSKLLSEDRRFLLSSDNSEVSLVATDAASMWKDRISAYLIGRGEVDLTILGVHVPRPDGYEGRLSVLLANDGRFLVTNNNKSVSLIRSANQIVHASHSAAANPKRPDSDSAMKQSQAATFSAARSEKPSPKPQVLPAKLSSQPPVKPPEKNSLRCEVAFSTTHTAEAFRKPPQVVVPATKLPGGQGGQPPYPAPKMISRNDINSKAAFPASSNASYLIEQAGRQASMAPMMAAAATRDTMSKVDVQAPRFHGALTQQSNDSDTAHLMAAEAARREAARQRAEIEAATQAAEREAEIHRAEMLTAASRLQQMEEARRRAEAEAAHQRTEVEAAARRLAEVEAARSRAAAEAARQREEVDEARRKAAAAVAQHAAEMDAARAARARSEAEAARLDSRLVAQ